MRLLIATALALTSFSTYAQNSPSSSVDPVLFKKAIQSMSGAYKSDDTYVRLKVDKQYKYRLGTPLKRYVTIDKTLRKLYISNRTTHCPDGTSYDRYQFNNTPNVVPDFFTVKEMWDSFGKDDIYKNNGTLIWMTLIVKNDGSVASATNSINQFDDETSLSGGIVTFCEWLEKDIKNAATEVSLRMTNGDWKLHTQNLDYEKKNNSILMTNRFKLLDVRKGQWSKEFTINNVFTLE